MKPLRTANDSTAADDKALLTIARGSIRHGLEFHDLQLPESDHYPAGWYAPRATFVTLIQNGHLRGCIGTTEATDPLVVSVARNAYTAAFHDPRFAPLTTVEYDALKISLSLLTEPEPLVFETEVELLTQLNAGRDGLIIEYGYQRATFLPSVWESLLEPEDFLLALKRKANLPEDACPERAWRYTTESISEA